MGQCVHFTSTLVVLELAHRNVGRVAQTVVFAGHVLGEKVEELLMVGAQIFL